MKADLGTVRFAFQPLYSLRDGKVVAVETLARPRAGSITDLLRSARGQVQLAELDLALATKSVHTAAEQDANLPLHVNLLATTAVRPVREFQPLLRALSDSGRRTRDVVLEICPPFGRIPPDTLLRGMHALAEQGFRIAVDGVGEGDVPMRVLAQAPADTIKIDRRIIAGLPDDPCAMALTESLVHLAKRNDAHPVAVGVETEAQLEAARGLGIRLAQGELLAKARFELSTAPSMSPVTPARGKQHPVAFGPTQAPRVRDFLRPAHTLPAEATADEVREVFVAEGGPTGVVLVDEHDRPRWSIDRNRFLLAVTGPYGHALHASKEAARLADPPHVIGIEATAMQLLDLVTNAAWSRTGDNVIVIDARGRCVGMVRVTEVVRGVAETKIEHAAALNPLTRLPGSDVVARDVDGRIAARRAFATAWLDVDGFKTVNDTAGFAAGDDLLRDLGRTLSSATTGLRTVTIGHVGGDDFLLVSDLEELPIVASAVLDRQWMVERLPVTVSLATLVCAVGAVNSYREVARLLAPLKTHAKAVRGSSWVLGRPGSDRVDVLRGRPHRLPAQRVS
ncbi:diguanylate cyclase/phosphodiesterase [Tamaricihabitans halophyticus]|uniref:Diguanylate cyclase/phosphodiesterase n=1 Tax=Tamaricihabitans halophyticus TaxID=1262583 RepID=A0A4R2R2K1_9PSEU|nr:diguanylate cyclase/phosphodiesterase [Tamaricihabitans halophyticus]